MPADLHVWAVPLRTRFRGLTVRDGVLVRGDAGWGEFSPFWDYDAAESVAWWRAAREAADVDAAVQNLVSLVGAPTSADVTVALVDGAVVSALTEHRPVRATARALLVAAWSRP